MTVPSVTFPIAQENIEIESSAIKAYIRGIEADLVVAKTIYRTIQSFCKHPGAKNSCCGICGADWGRD